MARRESYTPIIHGVFAAGLALNTWYLSSVAITERVVPQHYSTIIDIGLVLTGAFIAYLFRRHEIKKESRKSQKAAFNKAIATYLRQITILKDLKDDFANFDDANRFKRAIETIPYQLPDYLGTKQDIESLNFLIEIKEADLYITTSISQENFDQAINAIKARSHFFNKEVIPNIAKLEEQNLFADIETTKKILGLERQRRLVHLTNEMYEVISRNLSNLEKNLDDFFLCAKRRFPSAKFLYWNDKNPPHVRD